MNKRVNAILLAGDRHASIQVKNDNKAFLPLKGRPLFIHIIRALQQSDCVQDIVLIGPSDRIQDALQTHADSVAGDGKIRVVEQRENMIENFKAGYVASLGYPDTTPFQSLKESIHTNAPALVVPCDIPLITPWELDEFIIRSDMQGYDYAIGITSEKVLSAYHPTDSRPGIQMIYFHVREDLMRHNNLHLAKPLKFEHLDYIEKMYEWRYQTRWLNILRMMFSLLLVSWRFFTALKVFMFLQLSLYYDRQGRPQLADRLRTHAPLNALPLGIGRIIGAHTQVVYTHFGGAALDVDHDGNLDVINEMYDDWMAHQERIKNEIKENLDSP